MGDLLAKQQQKGELFTPKFVFNILKQISGGLNDLHNVDGVHGNLKESNILIFGTGDEIIVKLMDYEAFPGASTCYDPRFLYVGLSLI